MDNAYSFSPFIASGCSPEWSADLGSGRIRFPADTECQIRTAVSELADAETWKAATYLWFDAVNQGPHSMALTLSFWDEANTSGTPDLVSTIGLLPGLETRVTFPLSAIDSQHMFLPQTPCKLKTVIHGNKVRNLSSLAIGKKKCSDEQVLAIGNLHLSETEPEYPVPDRVLIDELGQWAGNSWPGKTQDIASLTLQLNQMLTETDKSGFFPEWTDLGAWREKQFEPTGFFRTRHDGKRWWLADPKGHAFYSIGVDCVRPGDGCNTAGITNLCGQLPPKGGEYADAWDAPRHHWNAELFNHAVANLLHAFGPDWKDAWHRITISNMKRWGFNTIGNWSLPELTVSADLPYVFPMDGFPTTEKKIFRDFPDVYSTEYQANAELFAAQMTPLRDDRNLIGYFLRNEPEWAFIKDLNIAEELLETDFPTDSREALIHFVTDRHSGDIDAFNTAWNTFFESFDGLRKPLLKAAGLSAAAAADLTAFSRSMVDRYVRIPSMAVRKSDPNHMNLGMRYGYISSDDLLAGSDCFDVFSINCYDTNPREAVEKAGRMTNLPVMIGEFHFGGLDRGLSATGIRGAANQAERGKAYRFYTEQAASSPYCVGVHYFQYNDQPTLGRYDGENYNIGLVDVCQTPHDAFLAEITGSHRDTYRVAGGLQPATTEEGALIHPIFY